MVHVTRWLPTWRGAILRSALLRLLLTGLLLVPATLAAGDRLLQASAPTMTRVFEALAPELHVLHLALATVGTQRHVRVQVVLARTLVRGGLVIEAGPHQTAAASTPARNGLLAPLLAALAVAAWPLRDGREALTRLLLCPALLAWCWVDAPLVLASTLWQPFAQAMAPGAVSALAGAEQFLAGGGRIAVGFSLAALVVALARLLASRETVPIS